MVNALDMSTKLTSSTAGTLAENGITHVGRYLGHDWKGLENAEAEAIKTAGMHIISIYENSHPSPVSVSYFTYDQGKNDAINAHEWATALGQPHGTAIYFTVDFDAQFAHFPAIKNYFRGVNDFLKDYIVGGYGSHAVIMFLIEQRLALHYYQTIAWSNHLRASGIHIYQYQCDVKFQGIQVDYINLEQNEVGSWGHDTSSVPIYTVKSGDTLGKIAIEFNTTVDELVKLNGLSNPNVIDAGQVLKLPSQPTPVAQPAVKNGWLKENNVWHYYKDNALVKDDWAKDSKGLWYYLSADGSMATNQWVKWKEKWYYLKADGSMATGVIEDKGKFYYLQSNGSMLASGRVNVSLNISSDGSLHP